MKKILTLIMAFMAVTAVYGCEISGKVVGENDAPLDYVNVVLYRDSTYITGTVTDQAGMFSIPSDVAGSLTAKFSFVGFETSEVVVPTSGNMGTIKLLPSKVELGEVVVRATRPSTTMKGNALVTCNLHQRSQGQRHSGTIATQFQ